MALVVLVIVDAIFDRLFGRHQGRPAACYRAAVSLAVCVTGFLLGIIQCTKSGPTWSALCNWSIELFGCVFIGLMAVLFIICYGRESCLHRVERIVLCVWFGSACMFITVMAIMGTVAVLGGPRAATGAGLLPVADTSMHGWARHPPPYVRPPPVAETTTPGLGVSANREEPPSGRADDSNLNLRDRNRQTITILSWLIAVGPLVLGVSGGMLHTCLDTMLNNRHNQQKAALVCCASRAGDDGDAESPEFPETPIMGRRPQPPGLQLDPADNGQTTKL